MPPDIWSHVSELAVVGLLAWTIGQVTRLTTMVAVLESRVNGHAESIKNLEK